MDNADSDYGRFQRVMKGINDSLSDISEETEELSIAQIRVLIFVMRRENVTGAQIAQGLELSRPTVSRCLSTLDVDDKARRKNKPPLGFIKLIKGDSTTDTRSKTAVLTAKGKKMAERIVGYFG
tara:strand:+ start:1462 stop:1833 length:372 start_codon:yes stop_codon:yes gene_type:complete